MLARLLTCLQPARGEGRAAQADWSAMASAGSPGKPGDSLHWPGTVQRTALDSLTQQQQVLREAVEVREAS